MIIHTRDRHLAAYIDCNGGQLVDVEDNKLFHFETEKSFHDWKVEHAASCCHSVDHRLMDFNNRFRK